MADALKGAAVVMVGTTHPGNLGGAARAMGNMGIGRLLLAGPKCSPSEPDAIARAAGFASILDGSRSFAVLGEALAGHQRAYAYTARRRGMSQRVLDSREAAAKMAGELAGGARVAMVFGPEQAGLSNLDTDMCDNMVEISAVPGKASLNVAAAVQIACHELRMASEHLPPERPARGLAGKDELQDLLDHAERVMDALCPAKNAGLRAKMRRRLSLIANRADMDKADVRMLRGLLSSAQRLGAGGDVGDDK